MAWDQIRGHDAVRDRIIAAATAGRLGHAYLFAGPEGVGKRLFATELAKARLCEQPPRPMTACGRCPACLQVLAGTHPDAFTVRRDEDANELDVETMREFCHRLSMKSSRGRGKIGIVEDADDFNASSANCFLKPLEEPPPGSLLILLATSVDRQLPTILSRCQVVSFAPLPPAEVRSILASNGVTDPDRVDRLVRLSGGSPGRALALNEDIFWSFRETLLASISAPRPDPGMLAAAWSEFVESAGKQGSLQRQRMSLSLRLLTELLQTALRISYGADTDDPDAIRLRPMAESAGPDRIADWLEACVEADRRIERYLQIGLVLDALLEKLFPIPMVGRR